MKNVTLISQLDPSRRIQGIKAVRGATGMGLKEAKDACDAVLGINPGGPKRPPAPVTIAVYEDRPGVMDELRECFQLVEGESLTTGISREDVLALVFEALSGMDSQSAYDFRRTPAFQKIAMAL